MTGMTAKQVKMECNQHSDLIDFHVKSHIEFDDNAYDQHLDNMRYYDLQFDYVIACQELQKYPKKYRLFTDKQKQKNYRQKKARLETKKNIIEYWNWRLA